MKWTEEQRKWLIDHYSHFDTIKEVTKNFNETFNKSRTESQITDMARKRLGLIRNKNKGTYGNRKKEELPIGTIRKTKRQSYIKVKVCDSKIKMNGYARPYWIPLQEKIYCDEYGDIPKDYFICFLNGNTSDFSLDNLYPINRKISAYMSNMRWWTNSKNHTLVAIKYCELFYALKSFC